MSFNPHVEAIKGAGLHESTKPISDRLRADKLRPRLLARDATYDLSKPPHPNFNFKSRLRFKVDTRERS
ncbi:unnamed protein product [Pieris brassicae]|uniref:Uncharacterized protein n=1 Tax=Pieris brassicae TaxID=7116 RepID=A0A9P0TE00_PIEBR|nr:unnamed protein product [Pieris brassicae]